MSSRGRGYSGYNGRGGGYNSRGNGYRGSYRGGGGHRGSYEGRGGRGSYSSYNSDTRYHSSSTPRYSSSRDRIEEPYKKSYRSEATSYSSLREYAGRSGSPERKRMRMEGSSSDRRSHDGGGHYGSSYGGGGRQESYSGDRRSFSGEDRRRSSPAREYRKPSGGMGPPREPRMTMRSRAPRRSFRGRTMRTRGVYRGVPRIRGSFASRRYGERSLGYTRAFRTIKPRSPAKSKEEASSTEEDWDADDKDEEVTEDGKEPKKVDAAIKTEAEGEASEAEGGEGDATDKEPDAASDAPPPRPKQQYVHLACVHCRERHATFAGYAKHLISHRHREAMNAVARRHKTQLLRMRLAQRNAQREIEAGATEEELTARTTYCLICRLNYRTTRREHNGSDSHLAMKSFLMPFCGVCRIDFRSPMIYEHHVCSLDHLKRKARNKVARRASPKATAASGDEGMDVDLDNFMTLDAVGDDVDEVEDDESSGEKKGEEKDKKPKVEINIGSEHIKKMEVLWCELCRVYLPRGDPNAEEGEAMRRHCRLRIHLSRYVQHRDTRTLRKQAERIHRQLHQQKEGEKEAAAAEGKVDDSKPEPVAEKKLENGTEEAANASDATAPGSEEKLWADVDKDLGELLSEVDPQGQEASDDEDELNRYDRFRKSDKKSNAEAGEETEDATADATNDKNEVQVDASA